MSLNIAIIAYKAGCITHEFDTVQTPTNVTLAILGSQSPLVAYKEWVCTYHPNYASQHLEGLLAWQQEIRKKGYKIKVEMK